MESEPCFSLVEAPIALLQQLLSSRAITSTELCALYLHRISTYDTRGPFLNSIPHLNPNIFAEAAEADARRAAGRTLGPLDGIPYTLKDSFKYLGMTVASGSPAFAHLQPNGNAHLAQQLKDAGAIMVGKTNMPPLAAGGMQRGLYGRAESPYNADYLTAAYSSGSSNGSATSTAASFAAFGLGSETVSSGRSPASNNGLVCYTPSRGVLSCRGLWPLYVTCDVPVPHTRSVADMLSILDVLMQPDEKVQGDFWREQTVVDLPKIVLPEGGLAMLADGESLKGKRLAIPKLYIGGKDSHPNAKHPFVSEEVKQLWTRAQADLEALGATCIETDFPLVTNYEDDSTGHTNNVTGAPEDWNLKERGELISYAWDDFLVQNNDKDYESLGDADPALMFPLPNDFIPLRHTELKNMINYPGIIQFIRDKHREGKTIFDIEGMADALKALEMQRKRDLEDWMDANNFDAVVFPANGDVGRADVEENTTSAEHALQNGVKYSNGNRAIRHLGVPTVSVTMGTMPSKGMPVSLTICGKAGSDLDLLRYAYAYEQHARRRVAPPLTPALPTDTIPVLPTTVSGSGEASDLDLNILKSAREHTGAQDHVSVSGTITPATAKLTIYVDGRIVDESMISKSESGHWRVLAPYKPFDVGTPGYDKFEGGQVLATKVMVVVLAKLSNGTTKGELVLV